MIMKQKTHICKFLLPTWIKLICIAFQCDALSGNQSTFIVPVILLSIYNSLALSFEMGLIR